MFVVLLVIDPTSHELGSPAKPGRFNRLRAGCPGGCRLDLPAYGIADKDIANDFAALKFDVAN